MYDNKSYSYLYLNCTITVLFENYTSSFINKRFPYLYGRSLVVLYIFKFWEVAKLFPKRSTELIL